jgi:esterase/lipase
MKIIAVFIHGFMGHPREHQIIKELIENLGIETYTFILSGHQGGKIKYFLV